MLAEAVGVEGLQLLVQVVPAVKKVVVGEGPRSPGLSGGGPAAGQHLLSEGEAVEPDRGLELAAVVNLETREALRTCGSRVSLLLA